jgi:hypothetical protein
LYRGAPLWLSDLKRGYRLKPNEQEKPLISRAAIHLAEVEFAHPLTGEALRFSAALAHDIEVGLKYLRRYAAAPPKVDFTKA